MNPLPSSNPVKSSPKPSWKLATNVEKESFKAILSDNLNDFIVLENICEDVHCKDRGRGQSSIRTIVHKDKSPLEKSPLDICPEGHLSQTFFLSRYGLFDII